MWILMTGRWAREVLDNGISRRGFLKAAGAAAFVACGTLGCVGASTPGAPTIVASIAPSAAAPVPGAMIVATDPDPVKLVDKALDAYGLKSVVKSGDRVVIKANFTFARTPEQAACNNPRVLARIMERCRDAGASEVVVFDHTLDNAKLCLERSGIKAAVEKAGFKAMDISGKGDYEERQVSGPTLKTTGLAKILNDADVFIDAPVIKSHSSTRMTASMKNLMGAIYDRQAFHMSDLDGCIVDLAAYARPTLIIADAFRVLKTGGPGGGSPGDQVVQVNQLIVGTDPVAVDSYAATLIGLKAADIGHIVKASRQGLGEIDLDKVDIKRIG
jgi:uncharacterized protein (DUF362 family)